MALTPDQLTTIHDALQERTDEGLEYHLRRDIAECITKVGSDDELAAKWIVHNRTKVIWRLGEKPSIFVSKDDGGRYNGWFVTMYGDLGESLTDWPTSAKRGFVGIVGIQYVYEYFFGTDTENSEDVFDRNVAHVLRALQRLGKIQGCPLRSIEGPKILTESGGVAIHFFDGKLRFDLCNL